MDSSTRDQPDAEPRPGWFSWETVRRIRRARKRGRWRLLWVACLLLAVSAVAGVSLFHHFTNSRTLVILAAGWLEEATSANVSIGDAVFSPGRPLRLQNVRLSLPEDGEDASLLRIHEVEIDISFWRLLVGDLTVRRVAIIGPTLLVTEDIDADTLNYHRWIARLADRPQAGQITTLPEIMISEGRVIFARVNEPAPTPPQTMRLEGNLLLDRDSNQYRFTISPPAGPENGLNVQPPALAAPASQLFTIDGPSLTGSVSIETGFMSIELRAVMLDSPLMTLLPSEVRRWLRDLKIRGQIPSIRLDQDRDGDMTATIEVGRTELNPPGSSPELVTTVEQGLFTINAQKADVALSGVIEGFGFDITGRIEEPFSQQPRPFLTLEMTGDIARDPGWVELVTHEPIRRQIQRRFEEFRPEGSLAIKLKLTPNDTPRPDGRIDPFDYRCVITLHKVAARHRAFPLPVKGLTGEIHITPDTVNIDKLSGFDLDGNPITISAEAFDLRGDSVTKVRVTAPRLAVNQHLLDAMQPGDRRTAELFLDRNRMEELRDLGLIRTPEQSRAMTEKIDAVISQLSAAEARAPGSAQVAQLQARLSELESQWSELEQLPEFEPGGTIGVVADIVDDESKLPRLTSDVRLDLSGARILFTNWPMPTRVHAGDLRIRGRDIIAHDIQARTLTGGSFELTGALIRPPYATGDQPIGSETADHQAGQDVSDPELESMRILVRDLPIDALLLSTIPREEAAWLEELNLAGTLEGQARLKPGPGAEVVYQIEVDVRNGTARPAGIAGRGYPLDDIHGRLTIRPGDIQIHDLAARHDQTRWLLSGSRVQTSSDTWETQLTVGFEQLRLRDPFMSLVPGEALWTNDLMGRFGQYEVDGIVEGRLNLVIEPGHPPRVEGEIRPRRLSLTLDEKRIELTEGRGRILIAQDRLSLDQLQLTTPEGRISVSGSLTGPEFTNADLTLGYDGRLPSPTLNRLSANALGDVQETLGLAGNVVARQVQLRHQPDDQGTLGTIELAGRFQLSDFSANLAMPVSRLNGRLDLQLRRQPEQPLELALELEAGSLRWNHRLVQPLTVRMVSTDNGFRIDQLQGSIYDGAMTGQGNIITNGPNPQFTFELALQEVAIKPFLDPASDSGWFRAKQEQEQRSGENRQQTHENVLRETGTGVLSAGLSLTGRLGQIKSYRGRGLIQVRQARLFEFPLFMTVGQILNLNLPRSGAFDRASASFLVDGQTVIFEDIRFTAPTIEMRGQGRMTMPETRLNLTFHTRNPGGAGGGPFGDIWQKFKNEVVTVQVTGPLDQPEAQVDSFSATRDTLREIFGSP